MEILRTHTIQKANDFNRIKEIITVGFDGLLEMTWGSKYILKKGNVMPIEWDFSLFPEGNLTGSVNYFLTRKRNTVGIRLLVIQDIYGLSFDNFDS